MTFNLKNAKPVTGDVAGVYFVKNPDTPADNGVYVINVNGQAPIRMANAVNMDDYITSAIIAATYLTKSNPTAYTTPATTASGKEVLTADWIKETANSIAIRNTVNGYYTLTKAPYASVLFGIAAGSKLLSTAYANTFIGQLAGANTELGAFNVAIGGNEPFRDNVNGSENVAIGEGALKRATSPNRVIAIGSYAAEKNIDGINVTSISDSIFIGKNTRAKNASGDTNEIVIGYNAHGEGSNTVVIGNDDITDTYLKGNIHGYTIPNSNDISTNIASCSFVYGNYTNNVVSDGNVLSINFISGSIYEVIGNGTNFQKLQVGDYINIFYDSGFGETGELEVVSIISDTILRFYMEDFTIPTPSSGWDGWGAYPVNYAKSFSRNIVSLKNPLNYHKFESDILPTFDKYYNLGSSSLSWNNIYSHDGGIHTSDGRLKTEIQSFTQDELNASKQLSKEIGTYKFLSSISEKGEENARKHIGMTVQRAIEIMTANNLNPFEYGFICYDEWQDEFETIPAVEAKEAWIEEVKGTRYEVKTIPATEDEPERQEMIEVECVIETIEHPAIEAKESYQIQTKVAGSIYSFRYTELLAFICRGFEERLTALENV